MVTEVLKDKKKVLSNDKLVVEGKEFMANELNAKHHPHAFDVEKIDWDNDIPKSIRLILCWKRATSSLATQQRYKVLDKLNSFLMQ